MSQRAIPVTTQLLRRYTHTWCQADSAKYNLDAIADELSTYAPAEIAVPDGNSIYYRAQFEALDAALDPVIDVEALIDSHVHMHMETTAGKTKNLV
ncbi:hypothetical protein ONA92_26775 [Mycobacteroides salmoniphilum]|uniref:hypothetical protein n=1 Tax=Mycobacteroides salmoniphilum TaxID=404941 RepID=UPI0035660850